MSEAQLSLAPHVPRSRIRPASQRNACLSPVADSAHPDDLAVLVGRRRVTFSAAQCPEITHAARPPQRNACSAPVFVSLVPITRPRSSIADGSLPVTSEPSRKGPAATSVLKGVGCLYDVQPRDSFQMLRENEVGSETREGAAVVPRTVVYDEPLVQAELERADRGRSKFTGPLQKERRRVVLSREKSQPRWTRRSSQRLLICRVKDDYTSKIAKYVPGEVVAVSLAGFAAFGPTGNWVWFALFLGILANVVYLAATTIRLNTASRPRLYFYLLSAVAFIAWAAATIPQVRNKFGLEGPGESRQSRVHPLCCGVRSATA